MFNIDVDLSQFMDIYEEVHPDLSLLQQGIITATQYVRDVWVSAVQGSMLPGMQRAVFDDSYAKSLSTGEAMKFPAPLYGVVMPVNYDVEADRIENGYGAFDMKPGLLNGPKSRPLKDGKGRFNTVPFRHYTPTSNGSGSSLISVKMRMPDEVYKQAKQLSRSVAGPNGMNWGESLNWNSDPSSSWNGYQHKTNSYDGMFRVGAARHTQYLTFRRVSTPRTKTFTRGPKKGQTIQLGSDSNSWMHPGLSPNPLIEAVYNYCMPEVEKNLMALAEQVFGIK